MSLFGNEQHRRYMDVPMVMFSGRIFLGHRGVSNEDRCRQALN
jgi:hypothetical protein